MASKKSHSWWWDSHISPKNSKWLAENLEEMDKQVKEMLKLIEEEGDSFAKKAEMYYQRRPELVSHVENFYRMYRALAERYDNVTGELRRNLPSELQSQGSINGSDFGSDSPSPERTPERKQPHRKLRTRAAGFDVFLGSGGSSDLSKKGSDGSSSSSDSEAESDGKENGNGISFTLHQRILELEDEIRDLNVKLQLQEELNMKCQCSFGEKGDYSELTSKVSEMEAELATAKDKLIFSEAEVNSLRKKLEERTHLENDRFGLNLENGNHDALESELLAHKHEIEYLKGAMASAAKQFESDLKHCNTEIDRYKKELVDSSERFSQEKSTLKAEIQKLEATIEDLKAELEKVSRAKSLLETRVAELEKVMQDLKANSDSSYEKLLQEESALDLKLLNLSQANELLESKLSTAESELKQLRAEKDESCLERENRISELNHTLDSLKMKIKELETEKSMLVDKVGALDSELLNLSQANALLEANLSTKESELGLLNVEKNEACLERDSCISELNRSLSSLNAQIEILETEKSMLVDQTGALDRDLRLRNEKIGLLDKHLNQLHLEHAKLIEEIEAARRSSTDLRARVGELEEEVERQKVLIADGAELKREAIRQLCFSLEHYRDGYRQLRQLLQGQKRLLVAAS
ncbi:Protein NETWORKED 4A [Ananas comosus]|uniref:Protein NETWORKED 4A n=1 Tax=Ananas comosus TaxID=4615 RepID=A0A199UJE3_ANACO|nr:Protein NETWORKED 4A [Ananas comosus]